MTDVLSHVVFWWRTRRLAREIGQALAHRRQGRTARQRAARKGADTKFQHRLEGLKR